MEKITLVLKGYPRLSETFIAQEIYELEQAGLDITLVSLRHPTDQKTHPVHDQIKAMVIYLPEYLHQEPLRVMKACWQIRNSPNFKAVCRQWWQDFKRDISRNRIRRLGQSLVLAQEMPAGTGQLYAHFLHTPASVTRYASMLTGIPWSCSAHAKDIWTSPEWELQEKLVDLQWLATCTHANYEYLSSLAEEPDKVNLIYHGLDFKRFPEPQALNYNTANGSDSSNPVKLISVGRAVAKKGYDDLLAALATLPKDCHWHFTHIGGGPLLKDLKKQAEALGVAEHIEWRGALPQQQVLEAYCKSDLFVLASKIVADGDRDGLPNVLMEAQSQGLCCLATNISGIPELLKQDASGLMVEPESPELLAKALQRLITQPVLREQLGRQGLLHLHEHFDVKQGINQLVDLFQS